MTHPAPNPAVEEAKRRCFRFKGGFGTPDAASAAHSLEIVGDRVFLNWHDQSRKPEDISHAYSVGVVEDYVKRGVWEECEPLTAPQPTDRPTPRTRAVREAAIGERGVYEELERIYILADQLERELAEAVKERDKLAYILTGMGQEKVAARAALTAYQEAAIVYVPVNGSAPIFDSWNQIKLASAYKAAGELLAANGGGS